MRELRVRPKARRDLTGIYTYTKRHWSRDQADRYLASIRAEIERLRDKPELGRPVRGAQAPFFKRAVGSHVIFFLVDDKLIDIVRVLHERMDFVAHLANDET